MTLARLARLALGLAALSTPARAQAVLEAETRATLDRPESPVVLRGDRLPSLLGAKIVRLRALALHDGRLVPIPFQVDERTPDGGYAYNHGDERRSDPDDGALDDDDELVFMAGDAGDRLSSEAARQAVAPYGPPAPAPGPGPVEVELGAPGTPGRAWVYLARVEGDLPPLAPDDRVTLDWRQGELAGWTGRRARVVSAPGGTCFLDLRELRFARLGGWGPDVLDRAKLALVVHYLFLEVARRIDEVRAGVLAWLDGPVRAMVRFNLETYLIWGHWVRSTGRPRATIYEDRLELELELRLPVSLEADTRSELRLGLDLSPDAGLASTWTDRSAHPLRAGSTRARDLRDVDRSLPRWLVTSCDSGAFALRLELGPELQRPGHQLSVIDSDAPDPPEDSPGSILSSGWTLDLTGLAAGTYHARIVLQFGEPVRPGDEGKLLRVDDAPVTATVTAGR